MVWCQTALAAMALSGVGDTVLLDFYADWCGPCRAMAPTIDALVEKGYPVRKVNIDQHPELAKKYGVKSIPCYVMVVGGREVDRVARGTSFSRLERMCKLGLAQAAQSKLSQVPARFAASQSSPNGASAIPSLQSSAPFSVKQASAVQPLMPTPPEASATGRQPNRPTWAPMDSENTADAKLIAASVRLRVEDPDGYSWGSGTIIDARSGEALVLTCAHIFRDSQGKGRIDVDLFGPYTGQRVLGRFISYDLQRDVGLLSIRTPGPVTTVPVAPPGYGIGPNSPVVSVGCNNGDRPSARHSRVASLKTVLNPPSLQVSGLPVEGRSGGGLFSGDGFVIGVCYGADPQDNQGLYADLTSIYSELDRRKLSYIYRSEQGGRVPTGTDSTSPAALVAVAPPLMPKQMPASSGGWSPSTVSEVSLEPAPAKRWQTTNDPTKVDSTGLAPSEQAALDEICRRLDDGAEVICVIRSRHDPNAKSEIIMLDKVSPSFLRRLSPEAGAER